MRLFEAITAHHVTLWSVPDRENMATVMPTVVGVAAIPDLPTMPAVVSFTVSRDGRAWRGNILAKYLVIGLPVDAAMPADGGAQ